MLTYAQFVQGNDIVIIPYALSRGLPDIHTLSPQACSPWASGVYKLKLLNIYRINSDGSSIDEFNKNSIKNSSNPYHFKIFLKQMFVYS